MEGLAASVRFRLLNPGGSRFSSSRQRILQGNGLQYIPLLKPSRVLNKGCRRSWQGHGWLGKSKTSMAAVSTTNSHGDQPKVTKNTIGRGYRNLWFPLTKAKVEVTDAWEKWIKNELLRRSILTCFLIVVARAGSFVPLPWFDRELLLLHQGAGATMLTDGIPLSLFELGIQPYISASLFMSGLHYLPYFQQKKEEGAYEFQEAIKKWVKWLTFAAAFAQAVLVAMTNRPYSLTASISPLRYYFWTVSSLVLGSVTLYSISEGLTDAGFGHGSTILICLSILGTLAGFLTRLIDNVGGVRFPPWKLQALGGCIILTTIGAVYLVQGVRKVYIEYFSADEAGEQSMDLSDEQYIPFMVNPGGMAPILVTSVLFGTLQLGGSNSPIASLLSRDSPFFYLGYFLCIFGSNMVDLNDQPKAMSDYLLRIGARVKGIRPGNETIRYLKEIQKTSSFWGGLLLGGLATFSTVVDNAFRGAQIGPNIGITSILILVGCILQTRRSIEAYSQGPRLEKALAQFEM